MVMLGLFRSEAISAPFLTHLMVTGYVPLANNRNKIIYRTGAVSSTFWPPETG